MKKPKTRSTLRRELDFSLMANSKKEKKQRQTQVRQALKTIVSKLKHQPKELKNDGILLKNASGTKKSKIKTPLKCCPSRNALAKRLEEDRNLLKMIASQARERLKLSRRN
jgi:hypothetical protein